MKFRHHKSVHTFAMLLIVSPCTLAMFKLHLQPPGQAKKSSGQVDLRVRDKTFSAGVQKIAKDDGFATASEGGRHKKVSSKGRHASTIIFFPSADGETAAKCFNKRMEIKNKQAYKNEKSTFTSDRFEINSYNSRKAHMLMLEPHRSFSRIIKIRGYRSWYINTTNGVEKVYAAFLEAAKGQTLDELLENSPGNIDLQEIFFLIGQQLGNTYSLYYDDNLHLVHPDPHMGNFMFDVDSKQLYWIDISGIKSVPRQEDNYLLKNHELNISLFVRDMPKLAERISGGSSSKFCAQPADIEPALRIIRAHQALFRGYEMATRNYQEGHLTLKNIFGGNLQDPDEFAYLSYKRFKKIVKSIENIYNKIHQSRIDLWDGYSTK